MEMEVCHKIDLEFEADGLIGDKQFAENSVGFNTHELTGGLDIEKEVDNSISANETDHLPELHESLEPERNLKNGRYNLRKSLAWDSAFFTNAGVLDAEELSTMITGADKSEKHLLPGIQEEITGSTESLSTIGSDTLTMETLEDDLFVDIRASIQRSSKKASNMRSSNSNTATVEVDSAAISSLKKEDIASKNKIPRPSIKKTNSLQTVRMSKCQPKQNIGRIGSEKAIKQDFVHSQVKQTSVAKIGLTNSILPKPPKIISSSTPSSTAAGKRDAVGTGRVKSGILNHATVPGKGIQPPKVSSVGVARRALPKPAPSSTSSDSSINISSRINPGKSNPTMSRRNTAKNGNVVTGPSGSIPKTPSRATMKNNLPSSYKISSSVSPASSISEWSSASSSSSSMVNQKSSNSRTSIDTSSCRSMEGDIVPLDPRNHSADGDNNQVKSSAPSPNNRHPPSPSAVHKQASPKNEPATGISIRSSNSKPKNAKLPTARMVTSPASIKPSSSKPTSPASFQEKKSTDATNSPRSSTGVKQVGDLKINNTPVVVERSNASSLGGNVESENVNGSINELLSDTSGCTRIASEAEVCRAPLALKNSFVSNDMPNEVADKTGLLLPVSEQKENS